MYYNNVLTSAIIRINNVFTGISKFRLQSDGSALPSARRLTLTLFQDKKIVIDLKHNELLVPWGQFLTHDIAYSAVNSVNSSFPSKNLYFNCDIRILLFKYVCA